MSSEDEGREEADWADGDSVNEDDVSNQSSEGSQHGGGSQRNHDGGGSQFSDGGGEFEITEEVATKRRELEEILKTIMQPVFDKGNSILGSQIGAEYNKNHRNGGPKLRVVVEACIYNNLPDYFSQRTDLGKLGPPRGTDITVGAPPNADLTQERVTKHATRGGGGNSNFNAMHGGGGNSNFNAMHGGGGNSNFSAMHGGGGNSNFNAMHGGANESQLTRMEQDLGRMQVAVHGLQAGAERHQATIDRHQATIDRQHTTIQELFNTIEQLQMDRRGGMHSNFGASGGPTRHAFGGQSHYIPHTDQRVQQQCGPRGEQYGQHTQPDQRGQQHGRSMPRGPPGQFDEAFSTWRGSGGRGSGGRGSGGRGY